SSTEATCERRGGPGNEKLAADCKLVAFSGSRRRSQSKHWCRMRRGFFRGSRQVRCLATGHVRGSKKLRYGTEVANHSGAGVGDKKNLTEPRAQMSRRACDIM